MNFALLQSSFGTVLAAWAVFGLVLTLWIMGVLLWLRRRSKREAVVRQRLDPLAAEVGSSRTLHLWHEGEEATKTVPGRYRAPPLWDRLEQRRKDAGFKTPVKLLLAEGALIALGVFLAMFVITQRIVPPVVSTAVVVVVMLWYASHRISAREILFERQLVDGLELSARALRAGHPLLGAFHLISEEIPAPVGRIFSEICQQQAMGGSLDDALRRAAALTKNADMKLFSASLAINIRTGGNLADVVYGLAHVIRERMRLNRRFRVLIAQTQISKRILIALPVMLLGILSWLSPEYVGKLFNNTPGFIMLCVATTSLLLGWIVMNRMAALKA
ncbi:MAG: type II secretion system F family protein [Planctomycetota bacterium]